MSESESKSALVVELAEEFLERYRQGRRPSLKEYIDRHPELAADIRAVFPAMALMENVALADESLAHKASGPAVAEVGASPEQLGDYRVLREVGRGGMGVVYEAEQVSLGRHVALKMLRQKTLVDATQKQRFEREARAVARLHHTNIVPVFGVGEHDGTPYYVMQFIQGRGLDQVLDELKRLRPGDESNQGDGQAATPPRNPVSAADLADLARSLQTGLWRMDADATDSHSVDHKAVAEGSTDPRRLPSDTLALSASSGTLSGQDRETEGRGKRWTYWQSVARIGVQVADALEHAHKQRILHRDVKPSNLLLDRDGRVWVTDFGLARADDEDHLTRTGDVVGTLRYMPPEAFEGRADVRGDVYSLGITLYEMLALRPAYDVKDRHKLLKQVTAGEPPRLRKENPQVPRDLETIVHKAIDREPGRRYASAAELAADLQRFLDDVPIRARRIANWERLQRWARRNKGVAVLSAVALLLLVTVALVSSFSALRLKKERDAVRDEQRRANDAERLALAGSVKALLTASSDSVPFLLDQFRAGKNDVRPDLQESLRNEREGTVARLRLNVALALLGADRAAELCAAAAGTPPEESFNLVLGLKCGDREAVVRELWSHCERAKAGNGRTRLAIALLELGDPRAARAELALTANLTARVRFIHVSAAWHGDMAAFPDLLRSADDTAFRSGLCLAVGNVNATRVPLATRRALDDVLTELYISAADGGTHAAAEYALRQRRLALPAVPLTQGPRQGRKWFVNGQGMTMIALRPGCFQPLDYQRADDANGQPPHLVALTRTFFMADQETTAEWYRRFLDSPDHPKGEELTDEARQADPAHPLAVATRSHAVLFCNWLSRSEGRTPCYRPAVSRSPGMACDFTANGYRLPTDAEWEFTYRCGTTTRYFTGEDVDRMLEYGRLFAPTAGLGKCYFPNPWGFFDLLGNNWEMCWDTGVDQGSPGLSINPVGPVESRHAIRGGSHDAGLFYLHGSARYHHDADRVASFRVVCGPLKPEDARDENAVAEALLTRLVEQYPEFAWVVWKERGRALFELGHTEKAAGCFRKAVELLGDMDEPAEPIASEADKLFARLAHDAMVQRLTAAVERNPDDTQTRWVRGEWYARHQRWKEAAADFKLALERDPSDDAEQWLHAAPTLAAAGDREGYRRLCREMLKRFKDDGAEDPRTPERIAKACLVLPVVGKEEAAKEADLLCQLAERAVTLGKNHPNAANFLFCKGFADYRRGNDRAAVEGLDSLMPRFAFYPEMAALSHFVRAMALHRQGQEKAAREHLAQGARLLEEHVADPARFPLAGSNYNHDWLIACLLHREARTLIEGAKAGPVK